jgi:hypothetical protein
MTFGIVFVGCVRSVQMQASNQVKHAAYLLGFIGGVGDTIGSSFVEYVAATLD